MSKGQRRTRREVTDILRTVGGSFADPNPDIKVEQAKSRDAGIEVTFRIRPCAPPRFTSATLSATKSLIVSARPGTPFRSSPTSTARRRAASSSTSRCSDQGRHHRGGHVRLVDTEVVTNQITSQQFQPGQPLLRRPRHSGSFRAAYSKGRATVNFSLRMIGDRFDSSFSLRTVLNVERPNPITTDITVNPGYVVAALGSDFQGS